MLTAADSSKVPANTDATTATDDNTPNNEEPAPSSPSRTVPGSDDLETPTVMVTAPVVVAPTVVAPTATASDGTASSDELTSDATISAVNASDEIASDVVAEPSSADVVVTLTDPDDTSSVSTTGDEIEPDSAVSPDSAEIDADVPTGTTLALDVTPVADDVDRSGSSEAGVGAVQTRAVEKSSEASPAALIDAAAIDAATIEAATVEAAAAAGQPNRSAVPTAHATAGSQPVGEPAATPVADNVVTDAAMAAASANPDLADGSATGERAGAPARGDAVRPATLAPAAGSDRQAAAAGPTPNSPSVVSSGTGPGVPVTATLPFAGADLAAWRHFRSGTTSTMSMDVDTDTLGPLRIAASDLDGAVRLSLLSGDALSRHLLVDRLPELRRDLADAGIDFAELDVANRDAGQRHSEPSDRTDRTSTSPTSAPTVTPDRRVAAMSSPQTVPAGHLDLRL